MGIVEKNDVYKCDEHWIWMCIVCVCLWTEEN